MGIEDLRQGFKNPGKEFRLAPYWFWNHKLEGEKIKWQIRQMKDKGIGGFVIHSRPGLLTPYMSEKWLKCIDTAVKQAQKLGMSAWLFDEDGWPSGTAGGRVTEKYPEYRMSQLYIAKEISLSGPLKWRGKLNIEDEVKFIYAVKTDRNHLKGVPKSVIDLSRYLKKKEIGWQVPNGRWKVIIIARNVFNGTFFGCYLDLLNKDAVKKFIEYTHKIYVKRFSKYLGKVIIGTFFDEPGMQYSLVRRSIPWTPGILQRFRAVHRYSLGEYILGLFYDIGPKTGKVRCDYYEVATRLYVEAFFKQIYEYCEKNKLFSIGHVVCESQLFHNVKNQGDFFRTAEYMHWGGVDSLGHQLLPKGDAPYRDCNLIATKMAASSSHYFGKQRVMNEAFGDADGWKLNLRTLKALADWQVILGSNYFIPHALFYTLQGFRKWEGNPDHFYRAPYWDYYRLFADYLARLCYLFAGAEHIAEVAILYPVRTVWSKRDPESTAVIRATCRDLENLSCLLMRLHRDFDYLTEEIIQKAEIEKGRIKIKCKNGKEGETFKVLILPSVTTLSRKTLKNIERYCKAGGKVLLTNCLPYESEEKGEDKGVLNFFKVLVKETDNTFYFKAPDFKKMKNNLIEVLGESGEPEVSIRQKGKNIEDIVYCHYRKGDEDIHFFSNTSEEKAYNTEICLQKGDTIWEADAVRGSIQQLTDYQEEAGKIKLNLEFEPTESHLIIVSRGKKHSLVRSRGTKQGAGEVIKLKDDWRFSTEKPNTFPLTEWKLEIERRHGWARNFRRYKTEVWIDVVPQKAKLFIDGLVDEKIWRDCSVKPVMIAINGQPVICWREEFGYLRIINLGLKKSTYLDALGFQWETEKRISPYLRKGRNIISIETFGSPFEPAKLGDMMILIGSFTVFRKGKKYVIDRKRHKIRTGSWCKQGYPFYSGVGIYEQKINIPSLDKKMILCLEKVQDLADVWINNRQIGVLPWEPFKVDLSGYLKLGENKITIKVANTLYNVFHKESLPSGLLGEAKIIMM